eukprot:Filipodium_phascolosomae@DN950_c0_g1_i1.p1
MYETRSSCGRIECLDWCACTAAGSYLLLAGFGNGNLEIFEVPLQSSTILPTELQPITSVFSTSYLKSATLNANLSTPYSVNMAVVTDGAVSFSSKEIIPEDRTPKFVRDLELWRVERSGSDDSQWEHRTFSLPPLTQTIVEFFKSQSLSNKSLSMDDKLDITCEDAVWGNENSYEHLLCAISVCFNSFDYLTCFAEWLVDFDGLKASPIRILPWTEAGSGRIPYVTQLKSLSEDRTDTVKLAAALADGSLWMVLLGDHTVESSVCVVRAFSELSVEQRVASGGCRSLNPHRISIASSQTQIARGGEDGRVHLYHTQNSWGGFWKMMLSERISFTGHVVDVDFNMKSDELACCCGKEEAPIVVMSP